MPNKPNSINEEAGLGENWVAIDAPPIVPGRNNPAPPPPPGTLFPQTPQYLQGSIPPSFQHDTSFVDTATLTPNAPKFSLMPLGIQGNPSSNAAIQSTAIKTVSASVSPAPVEDIEEVLVNYQTGISYDVQLSDRDTLVSLSNNSGGTVYLPGIAGGTFVQYASSASNPVKIVSSPGNTLVLIAKFSPSYGGVPTITDTAGNTTWTYIGGTDELLPNNLYSHMLYAYNIKGGANEISLSVTGSSVSAIWVFEYTGMPLVASLDQHGASAVGVAPPYTPVITAGVSRALSFAALIGGTAYTPMSGAGTGWSLRLNGNSGKQIFEDQYVFQGASSQGTCANPATANFHQCVNLIADFYAPAQANPFPVGWFTYIENTGTGNFYINAQGFTIDGSLAPVLIGPNQGLLLVYDGTNWATCRGVGGAGFYQTIQQDGVSETQEEKLNFLPPITVTDDFSNQRTDIAVPVFVASGAGHATGLVPDPGASAGTTHYLREDATWAVIAPTAFNQSVFVDSTAMSDDYWLAVDNNAPDWILPLTST